MVHIFLTLPFLPVHSWKLSPTNITNILPHNHVLCVIFLFISFSDISSPTHTGSATFLSFIQINLYLAEVRLDIKIQKDIK